jgi:thymidylate kinase
MKIIVEGPDRVGKDTLILELTDYFTEKGEIYHNVYYRNIKNRDVRTMSEKFFEDSLRLLKSDFNIISNRSHLDEAVYGTMYRGYNGDYVFDLEKKVFPEEMDVVLILLTDEPENLIKREDGKSFSAKLEDKKRELSLFEHAFAMSRAKHKIRVNIAGKSIPEVYEEVINQIKILEKI